MARDIIIFGTQVIEHVIHSGIDVVCDLIQCFSLNLLSLEQLAHHIGKTLHLVLWSSLSRLCRLLVSRLFLVVELSILSWAEDKGSSLISIPPLVATILNLIALSIFCVTIGFRVVEQVGVVPHVRVRVIVLKLPSLPIHIANLMVVLSRLVRF